MLRCTLFVAGAWWSARWSLPSSPSARIQRKSGSLTQTQRCEPPFERECFLAVAYGARLYTPPRFARENTSAVPCRRSSGLPREDCVAMEGRDTRAPGIVSVLACERRDGLSGSVRRGQTQRSCPHNRTAPMRTAPAMREEPVGMAQRAEKGSGLPRLYKHRHGLYLGTRPSTLRATGSFKSPGGPRPPSFPPPTPPPPPPPASAAGTPTARSPPP